MSSEAKTTTLKPSKFALAASDVWNQSKDLLKKPEFKIDLGLDKKDSDVDKDKKEVAQPIKTGYVFGSRLAERVANPISENFDDFKGQDDGPKEVSSIFKKYAEKVTEKNEESSSDLGPSTSTERFKASMEEYAKKAINGTDKSEKVDITTGEEDEKTLFNTNCKFFMFNTETKAWVERGLGYVRLNKKAEEDWDDLEGDENIRLVGRITGTQKVVINSKVFCGMILEKLTEKRLKISAQCPDSDLPQLFIIQAAPASIAALYGWLITHIKNAQATHVQPRIEELTSEQRKRKRDDTPSDSSEENDTAVEPPKAPKTS